MGAGDLGASGSLAAQPAGAGVGGGAGAAAAAGAGRRAPRLDVSDVEGRLGRLPRPPEEEGGGRGWLKRRLPPVVRPGRRRRGTGG
eukprot:15437912-Alexandrium_andersonii.AAC.1